MGEVPVVELWAAEAAAAAAAEAHMPLAMPGCAGAAAAPRLCPTDLGLGEAPREAATQGINIG